MKLHEEFKEYETMWDTLAESREDRIKRLEKKRNQLAFKQSILETQTSTIFAEVEGTNKSMEYKGVPHQKALRKLLGFINTLTADEKLNLYFHWGMDDVLPNDEGELGYGKGDPILNKDSGELEVIDNTATAPVPEDAYHKVVAALTRKN
jgi:hypothetical protein